MLIEVDVERVAGGGWCVARHHRQVVFVRHALPGERVRARVTEETRRFLRAEAVEVLVASPDRVAPPCPYARPGRCGGCDWQHASLPAQRRMKAEIVAEQLRRIAGVEREVVVEEVPGAPDGLGWRTRVRFAVRDDGTVGLRRHRSHEIEPVTACLLAHPLVEQLGVERVRWPGVAEVEAIAGSTGERVVVVTARGGGPVRVPELAASTSVQRRLARGRLAPLRGRGTVREKAAGREWRVSGGFWQVHVGVAELLADAVRDSLQPRRGESALDLYCGAGLFAGVLAVAVGPEGEVVGVETDPGAVRDARHNLRDLPQARILRGRVEEVLARDLRRPDMVVVDPPRAGLGREVVARIRALAPRRLAYLSCDPATLARDVGMFAGWELATLRAFDAFPMTHHVECLALLRPTE